MKELKLTGDVWGRMSPVERENLRVKALAASSFTDPTSLDVGKHWDEYWGEEKRALIREFKKEQVATPKAEATNPSISKKAITGAEQEAKDEITRLITQSRSSEDALKSARMELEAIEAELGKRTIPYGGDFYRKRRGKLPQAFPGVPGAILDVKRTIYKEFIDELEQQLGMPKTRKQMLIDYDRGHTLEQLKDMCRKKGLPLSGGKKQLIARLI